MYTPLQMNFTSFCLSHLCINYEHIFQARVGKKIVKPYKFYSIMSSVDKYAILSVAKFLLSAFNDRKEVLRDRWSPSFCLIDAINFVNHELSFA